MPHDMTKQAVNPMPLLRAGWGAAKGLFKGAPKLPAGAPAIPAIPPPLPAGPPLLPRMPVNTRPVSLRPGAPPAQVSTVPPAVPAAPPVAAAAGTSSLSPWEITKRVLTPTQGKAMTALMATGAVQNMTENAMQRRGIRDHTTGFADGTAEGLARAGHMIDTMPLGAKAMLLFKGTGLLESDMGKKYISDWLQHQADPAIQKFAPEVMARVSNRLQALREGRTALPQRGMFAPNKEVQQMGQSLADQNAQIQYLVNEVLPRMTAKLPSQAPAA